MKNLTSKAALLLMCSAFILSSCSKDEETVPPVEKKVASVKYEFAYTLSSSVFEVAEITFTYLDEMGKSMIENITTENWSKKLEFKTFPAKVELKAKYKLKANLTKEKYDLSITPKTSYAVMYLDGTKGQIATTGAKSVLNGVSKAGLGKALDLEMLLFNQNVNFKLSADGNDIVVE